ncbi:MAG TPA: hypothetical protein VHG08_11025 [Longimicrobium sp.]|nr:hypothetical protein [Longimicrobium sp.]
MGFKDARASVVAALRSGQYQHEEREDGDEKNLLDAREVTPDFVATLLLRCSGDQYQARQHHADPGLLCHIFRPQLWGERWYIKVYFQSSVAVFISVHR